MTDVIRPRRAADLDALGAALAEQQAASHYPARWPLPIPVDRFIARDGELAAWTAERDGLPVGHVSVLGAHGSDDLVAAWTGALDLDPSRLAVVSALFTATAVRGAGLGGRLLDVAVAWARDHGLAPVLEVAPGHGPAAGIYHARGWQVVARLRPDWLPVGDPDVLAMVLPGSQDADSEPTGHSWAGPVE